MRSSTKNQRLNTLYKRLDPSGFKSAVLHSVVLPDWWKDEIAETDAGFGQMLVLLSRNLGLDIRTVEDDSVAFQGSDNLPVRLKKRSNATESDIWLPRYAAARVAQLAVEAMPNDYVPVLSNARDIRAEILDKNPSGVTLDALLSYCWEHGLPVVLATALPKGGLRGLAVKVGNRPAILLLKNVRYSAELIDVLAHELGHVACGHLNDDDIYLEMENPDEEKEADAFAYQLTMGDYKSTHIGFFVNAPRLLGYAKVEAEKHQVYVGTMARHVSIQTENTLEDAFKKIAQVDKLIEPTPDAQESIRAWLARHLVFSRLPAESAAYLQRVSGLEDAAVSEARDT